MNFLMIFVILLKKVLLILMLLFYSIIKKKQPKGVRICILRVLFILSVFCVQISNVL